MDSHSGQLVLTTEGMRQNAVGPLWDGSTSRSGTAHAGLHAQPPHLHALLRAARLTCRFAASRRWHSPSRRHTTPHIIRDRAGAIRPDFSVCAEASARPKWSFPVIAAFSLTLGKRKGLGLSFGFSGGRSAAISGSCPLQLGLRREATWLAQDALPFFRTICFGAIPVIVPFWSLQVAEREWRASPSAS